MATVLIVCTGNLCRSPMAAALLRVRLARDEAHREWAVQSAGTWAVEGRPASGLAIKEMADRGIDLTAHRSQPVSLPLVAEADLVLGATQEHVEVLKAMFPSYAPKVWLLSEMVGGRADIYDPYGGTEVEYAYVARELETLIEMGYGRIVALAEGMASRRC